MTDEKCPSCLQAFKTKHGLKIHHAQKHGESLVAVGLECEICGQEFTLSESQAKGRRFCSSACKGKWLRTGEHTDPES